MIKRITLFLFSAVLLAGAQAVQAQVTITTGYNAQQLAQMLVGQGVIMLNAQMGGQCPIEGPGAGAGKFNFNGNPSDIGIDSGIVLTSGSANNISNPASFFSSASFTGGALGDADLNAVLASHGSNSTTEDACVLEFDFVPAGDSIKFDYVFGSEEYPEFACSGFNDVFAFLINGPGFPAGLNNLAIVPGTTIPVAINTINMAPAGTSYPVSTCNSMGPGSPFSQYYIDNQGIGGQHIVYDGYTTLLTAVASVIPCDTYHLKLAIADAGDQAYDSGVFLKAGSLNSVTTGISAETTHGGNDFLDPHCIRGCKPGKFKFTRLHPANHPLTIHYLIGGTAVNGYDYVQIPDSIVIPAFQDSVILDINGIVLPTAVGPKTVKLSILSPYNCGNGGPNITDSSTITIFDSLYVKIPAPDTTVCPHTEVTIHAAIDSTLNYSWSPLALIPDPRPLGLTIHPKPDMTANFVLTVTMPGAPATCKPSRATFKITVEPHPTVVMPAFDTTVCLQDSMRLQAFTLPEQFHFKNKWIPATYLRNDTALRNKFFAPPGVYHYQLISSSPVAHCTDSGKMTIRVVPPFSFNWVAPTDTTINYGDKIQLNSSSSALYWVWSPTKGLNDPFIYDPIAGPLTSTKYTLIGIDKNGCKDTAYVNIDVVYNPKFQMPNAFSPNGDGINDYFNPANIQYEKIDVFQVFNRLGQLVYDGKNPDRGWDGTINGKPAPMDVYNYIIKLSLPGAKFITLRGTVTLVR